MTFNCRHDKLLTVLAGVLSLLLASSAWAQGSRGFDDIDAVGELEEIAAKIETEDVTNAILAEARSDTVRIETGAAECYANSTSERARLEKRLEPLEGIDSELVGADIWDQYQALKTSIDGVKARQARCAGLADSARALSARITSISNTLSQQFLSSRTQTVVGLVKDLPKRMPEWPRQVRQSLDLELTQGMSPADLLWLLIVAGAAAALLGIFIRRRFARWYEASGGDRAPPTLRYLIPKPVAEFAPLWLESAALVLVLQLAIQNASTDLIVIRVAWALLWFALGSIIINWATGPLSPAAEIRGLIPDHVAPIRLRLRLVLISICLSFVVLGEQWGPRPYQRTLCRRSCNNDLLRRPVPDIRA